MQVALHATAAPLGSGHVKLFPRRLHSLIWPNRRSGRTPVCMHAHVHVRKYARTHYACMDSCVCACMYEYMYACMYACVHACMRINACQFVALQ